MGLRSRGVKECKRRRNDGKEREEIEKQGSVREGRNERAIK